MYQGIASGKSLTVGSFSEPEENSYLSTVATTVKHDGRRTIESPCVIVRGQGPTETERLTQLLVH